jgi:hypothetical protein
VSPALYVNKQVTFSAVHLPVVEFDMTRSPQKERERFYVEEAARLLGKEWHLGPDRENPDFIVTEGTEQFGLEVVDVFAGLQNRSGARMKKEESDTQKAVDALRQKYEAIGGTPLSVKFVGDMCDENTAAVLSALTKKDIAARPVGHHEVIEADEGKALLRAHVTRAFRADWFCVNHRAGAVDRNPKDLIAKAIEDKAQKLPRYKKCVSLDDIRLLVVANRIMNSGKLRLEECPAFDLKGFQVVYFYSYPESVEVFGGADT